MDQATIEAFARKLQKKNKKKDIIEILKHIHGDGYYAGKNDEGVRTRGEIRSLQQKLESRQHRMEALKAITTYASATGQTIEAFAKAMASEAGQL